MPSGLIALLDDVAMIAKLASACLDNVVAFTPAALASAPSAARSSGIHRSGRDAPPGE